jgi:hypothetical protein
MQPVTEYSRVRVPQIRQSALQAPGTEPPFQVLTD